MGNSIGKIFKLTTFGESHGASIGGIIDGCPAGLKLDFEKIRSLEKPGWGAMSQSRFESTF